MNTHVESKIATIHSFRIEFNLDKQINIASFSFHLFFTFNTFIFHLELSCRFKRSKMNIIWLMHNVISILMFNIRVNESEMNENQHSIIGKFGSSRTTRGRHGRECPPVRAGPPQYPAERYHFLSTNDSPPSVAAAVAAAEICYMRFFNNTAF